MRQLVLFTIAIGYGLPVVVRRPWDRFPVMRSQRFTQRSHLYSISFQVLHPFIRRCREFRDHPSCVKWSGQDVKLSSILLLVVVNLQLEIFRISNQFPLFQSEASHRYLMFSGFCCIRRLRGRDPGDPNSVI
jgi:hypothetical protein